MASDDSLNVTSAAGRGGGQGGCTWTDASSSCFSRSRFPLAISGAIRCAIATRKWRSESTNLRAIELWSALAADSPNSDLAREGKKKIAELEPIAKKFIGNQDQQRQLAIKRIEVREILGAKRMREITLK